MFKRSIKQMFVMHMNFYTAQCHIYSRIYISSRVMFHWTLEHSRVNFKLLVMFFMNISRMLFFEYFLLNVLVLLFLCRNKLSVFCRSLYSLIERLKLFPIHYSAHITLCTAKCVCGCIYIYHIYILFTYYFK